MSDLSFLTPLNDKRALDAFADVQVVYTDLDGTLLAPGGKLLCDFAGNPSTAVSEAIVGLRKVGVEIIIVTGRSRFQGNEFIRILDALAFIGEMGTTKQERGASAEDISYDTGTFVWDSEKYPTPYDAISGSGAPKELFEKYAGKLEMNYPRCLNRDVTHALRGYADVDEVDAFFRENGYQLGFEDNGMLFTPANTSLVDVPEIHGYHIVPANTSKAIGMAKDMAERGLAPEQTVAIGDGFADIEMGLHTGSLVIMKNGLRNPRNVEMARKIETSPFVTEGICCDGWVEFANRIIAAKTK